MEKEYKNLVYFFGFLALFTFVGFYKKYFGLAPLFEGVLWIYHFHAITLCGWLALLIVQPLLITRGKLELHKALGKVSYFLVPLAFISMLLVYRNQYLKFIQEGKSEEFVLSFVFSPAGDAIPFIIIYLLAMLNKRITQKHMRYMVATGVIVGGPGIGRIFMNLFEMDIFVVVQIVFFMQVIAFILLITYDKARHKTFRVNPYTIAFLIFLIPNALLIAAFPTTSFWQSIAKWIVETI